MATWRSDNLGDPQMARDALLMGRRVQYWALVMFAVALPIGQSPTEVALGIGLLAWLVPCITRRRWPVIPRTPLNLLLVAWFLIAVCSLYNSIDLEASLRGLQKLLKYFALYLLVYDTVDSRRSLTGVLKGCVVGMAVVVGDGLWQAIFGYDLIYHRSPSYTLGGVVERIEATFHHPGSLGGYLATFVPLLVTLGLLGSRRWRWPLLGVCGLTATVVVLNRSRSGLLAFVCGLVLVAFWLRQWAPLVLAAVTAGVEVLTIPLAVKAWAATQPTFLHQLADPDRLTYWQAAINMVKAHLFIGVGTNTFAKAYSSYRIAGDPFTDIGPYAHNQYLHLAAELGWVGVTVFSILLVVVFLAIRRCLAARASAPFEAMISAGLGAGLIGFLIVGLFESSLFHARAPMRFWFLIGLIMAVDAIRARAVAGQRSDRPPGA